jgi:hypothetical protein
MRERRLFAVVSECPLKMSTDQPPALEGQTIPGSASKSRERVSHRGGDIDSVQERYLPLIIAESDSILYRRLLSLITENCHAADRKY